MTHHIFIPDYQFEKVFLCFLRYNFFTVFFCGGPPSCGGPGQLPSLPSLKSDPVYLGITLTNRRLTANGISPLNSHIKFDTCHCQVQEIHRDKIVSTVISL